MGGDSSFENCIPLCFDCHADMGRQDANHHLGSQYSKKELRGHRDAWYARVEVDSKLNKDILERLEVIEKKNEKLMSKEAILNTFDMQGYELIFINGVIGNVFYHKHGQVISIYGNFIINENTNRVLRRFAKLPNGYYPKTMQKRVAFGVESLAYKEVIIDTDGFVLAMPALYLNRRNSMIEEYSIDITFSTEQ